MRVSKDPSPMALTDPMATALRAVVHVKRLDTEAAGTACGRSASTLTDLCRRGFVKRAPGTRLNGSPASFYVATDKGVAALERHAAAQRPVVSVAPAWTAEAYKCPELGRTCHRPGAYDAFTLPSRFGSELREPKSAA